MTSTSAAVTWPRRRRALSIDTESLRARAPLAGLLALSALIYLWALSRNGWANQYYAAAVRAGTHSWKAFLFGSLDPSNYITVDKPPASLWVMELSARLLGFSSFSMLLPQALEGVAAVGLLYAAVRRWFGRPAALLSGLIFALTPVAALMFRFNNPDALLVLLLVAAAYSLTRALEDGRTRWLVLCGSALGFGFLTKELEAFLVLPAFALTYLLCAPVPLRRRVAQLTLGAAALLLSAGWWVALVELWPASARPYIGGSTDNSVLQLIFGYNGLERISSSGGGPGGAGGFSGAAGLLRLFNSVLGGQISWLLPAAAIALGGGLVFTRRRPRTDRTRAALLLWGGWLVVTAAVFSFMTGVIHPYYTNLLAPAISVLVGVAATVAWRLRARPAARVALVTMLLATTAWSYIQLDRTPAWHPWLRFAVLVAGVGVAVAIALAPALGSRRVIGAVAGLALLAGLAGPAAYTVSTLANAQAGQNVSAGPAVTARQAFAAAPGGAATSRSALVALLNRDASRYAWVAATTSWQTAASAELAGSGAVMAIGGFSGTDNMTLARFERLVGEGKIHYYVSGGDAGGPGGQSGAARGGPPAGFAPGAGGPEGGGPQGGGPQGAGGPQGGDRAAASQIQSWVAAHFRSQTVDGTTVYDLTQAKGA